MWYSCEDCVCGTADRVSPAVVYHNLFLSRTLYHVVQHTSDRVMTAVLYHTLLCSRTSYHAVQQIVCCVLKLSSWVNWVVLRHVTHSSNSMCDSYIYLADRMLTADVHHALCRHELIYVVQQIACCGLYFILSIGELSCVEACHTFDKFRVRFICGI